MAQWATAPMDRRQVTLFAPTLDDMIAADHPVRLFDELLSTMDWSAWERHYVQVHGQPPIHPRVVASVLLYGMSEGLRSSRRLEWCGSNALDFIWLASGRTIDHSTFCGFRTRFSSELKSLFVQLGRLAMAMGMVRLNQVALDGTRVRANSSRHGTAKAATLADRLAALDEQIEQMLAECHAADQGEDELFGRSASSNHLPRELADLKRRQTRLTKALRAAEASSSATGKVPVADPEAKVTPNKDGGYAPNYTPLAATDGQCGMIVAAEVVAGNEEGSTLLGTVDAIAGELGETPQMVLADAAYGGGANLDGLEQREVDALIPMNQREGSSDNPAAREDPTRPVARENWPRLPRNSRSKTLDRAAFVYRAAEDCYYCPQGHRLAFTRVENKGTTADPRLYRTYQCRECPTCPLGNECFGGKGTYRKVSHDAHEPLRRAMDARMASVDEARRYRRRCWIAETPFAVFKTVMQFRQFLLRGLAKVKTEWLWACTAFNAVKMVRAIARLRGMVAALA
jgi:transposase